MDYEFNYLLRSVKAVIQFSAINGPKATLVNSLPGTIFGQERTFRKFKSIRIGVRLQFRAMQISVQPGKFPGVPCEVS